MKSFCLKITSKTTGRKPEELLNEFRNSFNPRIAVTVDMIATGTDVKPAYLVTGMDERRPQVVVDDPTFATLTDDMYIKVGTEWMTWSNRGADYFQIRERGVRGTVPANHERGTTVRCGYTVERVIMIPSYREDWNFR